MSPFNRMGTSRVLNTLAIVVSVAVLSACGTLKQTNNDSEAVNSEFDGTTPRDFITHVDLARIKLGMSPVQVKNRLGTPTLIAKEAGRWEYVLKQGQGAEEEFVPYGVFFKDQKVVRLAAVPLSTPPVIEESPVVTEENRVEAPAPSMAEIIMAPDPSLAVGGDVNDAAAINDVLNAWVAAWSAKNVDEYLSFYASTFEHGKRSRETWEKQRRERLSGPAKITVGLRDVQIDVQSAVLATVKFRQDYSSDRFRDSGKKVLTMSKNNGVWRIQSEEFLK